MNLLPDRRDTIASMIHTGDSANIAFYRERGGAAEGYVFCEVLRQSPFPPKGPDGKRDWTGWHPLPTFSVTVYRQGVGILVDHYRYEPKTRPRPGPLSERTVTQLVRRALGGGCRLTTNTTSSPVPAEARRSELLSARPTLEVLPAAPPPKP